MHTTKQDDELMAGLKPGCICMGIRLNRIRDAVESGAASFAEIAALTGIGRGDCGGRRCREKVEGILGKREVD